MKLYPFILTLCFFTAHNVLAQNAGYTYKKYIPSLPVTYTANDSDLTLSANSLSFGSADVGGPAVEQSLMLLNTGKGTVSFSVSTTGPYTAVTSCATAIPKDASCLVNVSYLATMQGSQSGTVSISTSAQTLNVALNGTGLVSNITTNAPSQDLGTSTTGANVSANVTFNNSGNKAATNFYVEIPAGWSSSGTCPTIASTLPAGAACNVLITQNALAGAQSAIVKAYSQGQAAVGFTVSYTGQAALDPYLNNVGFLMTGENGITNEALSGVTFTTSSIVPTISSADKVFGTNSIRFSADIDYVRTNPSTAMGFGSGDFTMETWVKVETWNNSGFLPILDMRVNRHNDILPALYYASGNILFYPANASTPAFGLNEWHHVAYSKNNGVGRLFIDGNLRATVADNYNYGVTGQLTFGQAGDALDGALTCTFCNVRGNFDNVRVTKGVGRYTTNFTPSDTPRN